MKIISVVFIFFPIAALASNVCTDNWQETKYKLNDLLKHRACAVADYTSRECLENIGLVTAGAAGVKKLSAPYSEGKTPKVKILPAKACGLLPRSQKLSYFEVSIFSTAVAATFDKYIYTDAVKKSSDAVNCADELEDLRKNLIQSLEDEKLTVTQDANLEQTRAYEKKYPELKALYDEKMKLRNAMFESGAKKQDIRVELNRVSGEINSWYKAHPDVSESRMSDLFWDVHGREISNQNRIYNNGYKSEQTRLSSLDESIKELRGKVMDADELAFETEKAAQGASNKLLPKLVDLRIQITERSPSAYFGNASRLTKEGFTKVADGKFIPKIGTFAKAGGAAATVVGGIGLAAADSGTMGCAGLYSKWETVVKDDDVCKASVNLDPKFFKLLRLDDAQQRSEFENDSLCRSTNDLYAKLYPSTMTVTCGSSNSVMLRDAAQRQQIDAYFDDSGDIKKFFANHKEASVDNYNVGGYTTEFSDGVIKSVELDTATRKTKMDGAFLASRFKGNDILGKTVSRDLTLYLPRIAEYNQCCIGNLPMSDHRCAPLNSSHSPEGGARVQR